MKFARLLVHIVEEVEQPLVDVDCHFAAVHLDVGVVLGVVDVEVERHLAFVALQHGLQVGDAGVLEQCGVYVDGELVYRLVLHVAQEFYLLYHQIVGVWIVAETLLALCRDVYWIFLL